MTDQPTWKTITIPKRVYLPTGSPDGAFKDTGLRVEPSDKVELLPGSRRIRVNGTEHNLLIPVDHLPLDASGNLRLDKPAPPVASLSGGGKGRAAVGRQGEAVAAARQNWDQETATNWGGDGASHIGKDWIQAQLRHADKQGAFDDVDDGLFKKGPDDGKFDPTVLHEERVTRTVTLRDGKTAEVLIDPTTGREAGFVSRTYSGTGVLTPKEAARMLAEQNASAQDVTHHPAEQPSRDQREPKVAALQSTPTGINDLDGLLGATTGCPGLPLGTVSYFFGSELVTPELLHCPADATCTNIETAFARIHLRGPLITVTLPPDPPTDALRLTIAEQLPALIEATKAHGRAHVAILVPTDWQAATPALLNYLPTLCIKVTPHDRDDRFITATITKGTHTHHPPTVSCPR